jgi:PGF-pre-PGF domain-containing protein
MINKDQTTAYIFKSPGNPVVFVNITGNVNYGLINTAVEVLKGTSSMVNIAAPGTVYKNINTWAGTSGFATPKNIKDGRISFKVENTWLTSGGFKDLDIVLVKWDGAKWISLETFPTKTDGTFTYFDAMTTSFSNFAITAMEKEEIVTPTPQISGRETQVIQPSTTTKPSGNKPLPFELFVGISGLLIVFLLGVMLLRRKKGL